MQFETKTSDNYFSIRITAGIFDSTKFKSIMKELGLQ